MTLASTEKFPHCNNPLTMLFYSLIRKLYIALKSVFGNEL